MNKRQGDHTMRLDGKMALITGGGSGIGLATAKEFLEEGARVVIAGRDEAKLAAAAKSLGAGKRLSYHAADVTKVAEVKTLVRKATETLGRIDILVNNAGVNIKDRAIRRLTP